MAVDREELIEKGRALGWKPLGEIDDPDYFVGQEHHFMFNSSARPKAIATLVESAFGALVAPTKSGRPLEISRFIPVEFVPVVATREELGYPLLDEWYRSKKPTDKIKRREANVVHVGGFVKLFTEMDWIEVGMDDNGLFNENEEAYNRRVASRLRSQIPEAA